MQCIFSQIFGPCGVKTQDGEACLSLFSPLLKEAMISRCIVELHPVQKCSGKTAAALCAGEFWFAGFVWFFSANVSVQMLWHHN